MGLIIDSSALIAGERSLQTAKQLIQRVRVACGDAECAISAISVIELTHGIYRARTGADRMRREAFAHELFRDLIVHPVSLGIAQPAGRIEGEQAARELLSLFKIWSLAQRHCMLASMS